MSMDEADFDAVAIAFACWNCGTATQTEIQTKLHQGPRNRNLSVGDEVKVGALDDAESVFYDIVLNEPRSPGCVTAAYDWRCPACKQINWVQIRVENHKLAAIEPLTWNDSAAGSVHLVDGGGATSYLFRDAGMDCWLDPITLEVHARRKKGQTSVEPYRQTISSILPGRFRTLLAGARFRSESPFKGEDYVQVFAYEPADLCKDLVNTARLYREHPTQFPRYVPAAL